MFLKFSFYLYLYLLKMFLMKSWMYFFQKHMTNETKELKRSWSLHFMKWLANSLAILKLWFDFMIRLDKLLFAQTHTPTQTKTITHKYTYLCIEYIQHTNCHLFTWCWTLTSLLHSEYQNKHVQDNNMDIFIS